MKTPLSGILPVAPTPFFDDGRVDTEGMTRVLDCIMAQGVDAICVLANYSEQFVLSDEERKLLMRISLEHVGGQVPMIVTISHYSTNIAIERAKAAQVMGASMVMMMPPYHGVGITPSETGIYEHYKAVSDSIEIPIMVQDAPLSGCQLSVPLLARMAQELDHVKYFKLEMPFAAEKLSALIEAGADAVEGPFDGEEAATLLADLDAGCTGTMTSGLQCEHIGKIIRHYLGGDKEAALAQWTKCLPLINHENRQCGLRACKTVMKEGGVIRSDYVRHPQQQLSARTRGRLLDLANDLDLIALRWGK